MPRRAKMNIHQLFIQRKGEEIVLSQSGNDDDGEYYYREIYLSPDQVNIVCKGLKCVAKEIKEFEE
jgi:hypothetical protein